MPTGEGDAHDGESAKPGPMQCLRWIILAAVPSGLMLSTTTYLTTDLLAMPLLWAIPLGLYLLSFSIAFADRRGMADSIVRLAPPVLLVTGGLALTMDNADAKVAFAFSLILLFVAAVALHTRMYRTRPDPEHLTLFYLMMAIGGAVGGALTALIAPLVFDWTYEYPLLILAAGILIPQSRLLPVAERLGLGERGARLFDWGLVAIVAALGVLMASRGPDPDGLEQIWPIFVMLLLAQFVVGRRAAYAAALAALLIGAGGWTEINVSRHGERVRSYFGIYTIRTDFAAGKRQLIHGTTLHGTQLLKPGERRRATSYYGPSAGVGLALSQASELYGKDASIGVIGLGAGTLACYREPGQDWRFFEIDPAIIGIARDTRYFSFLADCAPEAPIIVGDARLSIAREPAGAIDILAVDAFSSDAIPMHLLTHEAFDAYERALSSQGLLLVHISNRYLDLEPVLAAEAQKRGWALAARQDYVNDGEEREDRALSTSLWVALSPSAEMLSRLTGPLKPASQLHRNVIGDRRWARLEPDPDFTGWTDDYGSVLPLLTMFRADD